IFCSFDSFEKPLTISIVSLSFCKDKVFWNCTDAQIFFIVSKSLFKVYPQTKKKKTHDLIREFPFKFSNYDYISLKIIFIKRFLSLILSSKEIIVSVRDTPSISSILKMISLA